VPDRVALIVATAHYEDAKFAKLRAPSEDVAALKSVLADPDIGNFQVTVLFDENSQTIRESVEKFFQDRGRDDLLVLYFSGHGIKDRSGRLYLAAANTQIDLLASTGVASTFINEQIERSRSRRIALLLDCCYSGAFSKGFAARSSQISAGVSEELSGHGRVLITASDALQYAYENDEFVQTVAQPALFTGAVVEGLRSGEADKERIGQISADDLYEYVYDRVVVQNPDQTPEINSRVQGRLYLAANPKVATRKWGDEIDPVIESSSAVTWQREESVQGLRDLIEEADAPIAKAAKDALEKLTADRDLLVRAAAMEAREDVDRARFARASVLVSNGDISSGLSEFERTFSSTSSRVAAIAQFNVAVLNARLGHHGEAERLYRRVAESGEPHLVGRAWLNLGCSAESRGDKSEALEDYRRAIDSGDELVVPRAAFLLGRAAAITGRFDEALRWFSMVSVEEEHPFGALASRAVRWLLTVVGPTGVLENLMFGDGLLADSSDAWVFLARELAGERKWAKAQWACDRAQEVAADEVSVASVQAAQLEIRRARRLRWLGPLVSAQ